MLIMLTIACIPTFNEEANIQQVIKKTKLFVDLVVICDDGSTDNTANLAEESNAYVIRHKTNLGKGAALKSLFKYAKDCDADSGIKPESIRLKYFLGHSRKRLNE